MARPGPYAQLPLMSVPGARRAAVTAPATGTAIRQHEFDVIREWVYRAAGISLSEQKKVLVMGRLASRLRHHGYASYGQYFALLESGRDAAEAQIALDLLTTNETHFFRESKHFDFLRDTVLPQRNARAAFRVWSAASSSGEEAYSIAMTLAAALHEAPWEVLASDVSSRVLARAAAAHYPLERTRGIPRDCLQAYCLKGVGPQAGTFMVARPLRERVRFEQINLNRPLPAIGEFDVIFLRNVMIYFDADTKRRVVERVLTCLKPGGYLLTGHAENLNGISTAVSHVAPATYRKP